MISAPRFAKKTVRRPSGHGVRFLRASQTRSVAPAAASLISLASFAIRINYIAKLQAGRAPQVFKSRRKRTSEAESRAARPRRGRERVFLCEARGGMKYKQAMTYYI